MRRTTKKAISAFLCLLMILSLFTGVSFSAGAEDPYDVNYTVRVTVTTTNDADGWNTASLKIYTKDYNGRGSSVKAAEYDIKNSIDESNETFTAVLNCGAAFPEKVVVYTDFGGGFTWREWNGSVKIYVNGNNVKAETIYATSGAFESSNKTNTVKIDESKYPYPVRFSSEIPAVFRSDTPGNPFTPNPGGRFTIRAIDQYDVLWQPERTSWGAGVYLENTTTDRNDPGYYDYGGYYPSENSLFSGLTNATGVDHSTQFAVQYNTANSAYPMVEHYITLSFAYPKTLTVTVGEESTQINGYKDETVALPAVTVPAGYTFNGYTKSGYGTLTEDGGVYSFLFGSGDAALTAKLTANKYKIHFDGNGKTSGSMSDRTYTYDKATKLPSCSYKRTGWSFVGWNTAQDGSGDAYANLATVKNLTAENNAVVTLYAQWEETVHTVMLAYPNELGLENPVLEVKDGGSVTPEAFVNINNAEGHYRFTGADKALTNIRADATIALQYAFEAHSFGTEEIITAPTCSADGLKTQVCGDCGYTLETVLPAEHQNLVVTEGYAATCTENGLTDEVKCLACDRTVTAAEVITAPGHDYDTEYTDDKLPTCETAGEKSRHCRVCGARTAVTEIPAAEHKWEAGDVLIPACTGEGKQQYVCSVCGANTVEALERTAHTPKTVAAVAATCTEDGLTEGSFCEVCGETLTAQEVIPAAHTPKTVPAVAATCTEDGHTEGVVCEICGEPLSPTEVIPAAHTPKTMPAVAATCTETGLTEGTVCEVCGEPLTAQEVVPALGHTDDDKDGYCDRCREKLSDEAPAEEDGSCPICHEEHTGFFGMIKGFFHRVMYFFRRLFGRA